MKRISLSRQGKNWSKYRCRCGAPLQFYCVCTNIKERPVTWKELNKRALSPLFSRDSIERITLHSMPRMGSNLFVGRVFTGREFELENNP